MCGTDTSDGSERKRGHYPSSFTTECAVLEKVVLKKMATEG